MTDSTAAALPGRLTTLAVLMMAAMTIMANAAISPSLPGLREHFADVPGIDTLAGLILTLPAASIVLTAGLFGWLADRYDRQKLLLAAALLYAVGGGSGLFARTLPEMLAGRMILGAGVAGTMTLAMTWGAELWQGPARARFMGWQGASMSLGGVVVAILGGALATLHWRGAFSVYLLVVPVVALALVQLAPYARAHRARRAAAEKLHIVDKEPFPWPVFALVGGLSFFFMATFYVVPTRIPFLLQDLGVTSSLVTGLIMALLTLCAMPGSLSYGRLRRFLPAIGVFALSFGLMGAGMVVIALAESVVGVVVGIAMMGAGMGPSMPNFSTFLMAYVPATQRGRAAGLLTTALFGGQFASPLVSAPLVSAFGLTGALEVLAFLLLAVSAVLAVATVRQRGTVPSA